MYQLCTNPISDGTVKESDKQNIKLIKDTWLDYSEKLFTDKAVQIIQVISFWVMLCSIKTKTSSYREMVLQFHVL